MSDAIDTSGGNGLGERPHKPVLLREVLSCLDPSSGEIYVDATFGAGGYTRAILEAANCTVIALDRDVSAKPVADKLAEEFGDRFKFVHTPFSNLKSMLKDLDVAAIDGLVLDIGVSSMQLDQGKRGFSFQKDGPLDMRMDQTSGLSAQDIVAEETEKELARIIWEYGEERHSRGIAKAICEKREEEKIDTTSRLADIVRAAIPGRPKPGHDKATKTFQALRVHVNDELGELKEILNASVDVLSNNGRLVVVSFHSLEDRIVKQFLTKMSRKQEPVSRYMPMPNDGVGDGASEPPFELLSRKAIKPSDEETEENPRARSARLRAAKRVVDRVQSGDITPLKGGKGK